MPNTIAVTISIGTDQTDARSGPQVVDSPIPFVSWTLPAGYRQRRYSIRVENAEVDGFAFITSGPRSSGEQFAQFSDALQLNPNFNGLCRVQVALSQNGPYNDWDDQDPNAYGEFEDVTSWHYFVYDTSLERLVRAHSVAIAFQGNVDADQMPGFGIRYHLQISGDPLFTAMVYEDDLIFPSTGSFVQHQIPATEFDPVEDQPYFYRVRMFDGMDFGPWSRVNGFQSLSNRKPTMTIDGIEPQNDLDGTVWVRFTVNDPDGDTTSVGISYLGGNAGGVKQPLLLAGPTVLLRNGQRIAVWRTLQQLGYNRYTNLILYGVPHDGRRAGDEVTFGPITINNTTIPQPPGGVGSTEAKFPVGSASLIKITKTEHDVKVSGPAEGMVSTNKLTIQRARMPVTCGPYAWPNMFSLGALEPQQIGMPYHMGFGHATYDPSRGIWPVRPISIIQQENWDGGRGWSDIEQDFDSSYQTYVQITRHAWIFSTPYDVRNPTTLPIPMKTRDMDLNGFLRGYTDLNGTRVDYPDGYDWDHRPAWHVGREIWDKNDAWIQVAFHEMADHRACNTCNGRGWIPTTGGAPFFRVDCPNCLDGQDKSQPNHQFHVLAHIKTKWFRLSKFLHEKPFPADERQGLPIFTPNAYAVRTQYVWGRQVSTLDDHILNPDGTRIYLIPDHGYVRRLPLQEVFWPAPTGTEQMFREPDAGVWVNGAMVIQVGKQGHGVKESGVAQGSIAKESNFDLVYAPAEGYIGQGMDTYYMGGVDPTTHPLHSVRNFIPDTPTSIRVNGKISRQIEFLPFQIRFFQAYWDAFNTIHWQYNPNESTQAQLQYAKQESNGSFINWRNVRPENSTYNASIDAWLVDPFTFHAYWDTYSQTLFEDGAVYTLRIRLFSPQGSAVTNFVFSTPFRILRNVSNPVSVLATEYEPFSKIVTATIRVDDTQGDKYNLTRFWYSVDDGITWIDVPRGNVYGELSYLSSDPANRQNEHTVYWDTSSLSLQPGDKFRLKIESMPSDALDTATLPLFKWLSPNNPFLDEAEETVTSMLGRVERWRYEDELWKPNVPPVRSPGDLVLHQQEYARVRADPQPSGVAAFLDDQGSVVDQVGYDAWLAARYVGSETHGQAMSRIAKTIDTINRVTLPAAQTVLSYRENEIRRNLIEQGYYAEKHFKGNTEIVDVAPVSNLYGEPLPTTVERWWNFRVQKSATGGTRLTDGGGNFAPREITPMEQVYYKFQMDRTESFDSQPLGLPLREILLNERGERLSVSIFYASDPASPSNPAIDDVQAASPATQAANSEPDQGTVDRSLMVGGVLKIKPSDLPGQRTGDQMIDGQTTWDGIYYWRIAAYNYVLATPEWAPRPMVGSVTVVDFGQPVRVSFKLKGHRRLLRARLTGSSWYFGGLWYSRSTKTPTWEDVTPIAFVSDRRAPISEPSRNVLSWTPDGRDRPHPCLFYDEDKQQYVLFFTKNSFTQSLVNGQWVTTKYRPCSARAMRLPEACEYANYFEPRSEAVLSRPSVLKVAGIYWMFMTAIPAAGQQGKILVCTSPDADAWSVPLQVSGIPIGINPSVCHRAGLFHMWYERLIGGRTVIAHATSDNGYDWIADAAVYQEAGDVSSPGVCWRDGAWRMFFNAGQTVASVTSSNGSVWSGRRQEFDVRTVNPFGTGGQPGIPCNAYPYVDSYLGNEELFVAMNFRLPDGTHAAFVAREESREWTPFDVYSVTDGASGLTDMASSATGTDGQFSFNVWWDEFGPGDDIRVRMQFESTQPSVAEFHRQSAWVTRDNVVDGGGDMLPTSYRFNEILVGYPYMTFS